MMLSALLSAVFSNLMFLVLHVTGSGSFPRPLTGAQERDLLRKMKNGDRAARTALIEHNLRLVAHIVKKYYSGQSEQDDLISIGTIGLIKAVDTFDCEKAVRLSSYTARCIENELLMFFRSGKKSAQDVFLSEPIDTDKDGNALTLMDIMSTEDNIADDLDNKIKTEKLRHYIASALDPRERTIIELRYGLDGGNPLAQREVAARLGISRSYVSQRRYCKRFYFKEMRLWPVQSLTNRGYSFCSSSRNRK